MLYKKTGRLAILLSVTMQVAVTAAQNFNLSFHHINSAGILPEKHVMCFFRDSIGFIWLGTKNGLVRFDGVNVKTFQHASSDAPGFKGYNVNKILNDKNNNLWIGTDYGLNFYDVHTNTFKNFPLIPSTEGGEKGMCYTIPITLDDSDRLWLFMATTYSLYTFDINTYQLKKIPCKADLKSGVLPAENFKKVKKLGFRLLQGVVLYDVDNYNAVNEQQYFSPKGLFPELIINEASVFFQNDSIVWITCDKGLIQLDYLKKSYHLYNTFNNTPTGKLVDARFYDNSIIVSSAYNGLFVFDVQKNSFVARVNNSPSDPNSLLNNKIYNSFISQNTLFVSFEDGWIDFTNIKPVFSHQITKQDVAALGIKNQLTTMCQLNNGAIWFGTSDNGIIAYNISDHKINFQQTLFLSKTILAKEINHIAYNDKYIAVSSNEGLYVFDNIDLNTNKRIEPVIKGGVNYAVFFNDTILLATTNDGLYQLNIRPGNILVMPVKPFNNEQNFKNINIYHKPGTDKIYVMAEYGSFIHEMKFDKDTFSINRSGWLSQNCTFITAGRNDSELLMCGPHGIISFNTATFTPFNIDGKLFSNQDVSAVLRLSNSNWFIAYNKGAVIYDNAFNRPVDAFDESEGLYNTSFYSDALGILNNGNIVLGTNDGMFLYDPTNNLQNSLPLPLYFSQIEVNDGSYSFDKDVNYLDGLHLGYNENTISFSFSTIDFAGLFNKKIEYKMEGVDKAWIPAQRNGFARYANLPAGNYIFMVRNYNGTNKTLYKQILINIASPFWHTWWFILLCIASVFCIIYLLYSYRIQQLIQLQKVRNRIATDLHDDIGSTLTNINILAELSSNNINDSTKASAFLQRISEEVTATSESLDDIVWSINTKNDSFSEMAARMRRYAAELFESEGIACEVLFDDKLEDKKLQMEQRRDIYLVFKEGINNIYKHANAHNVSVSFQLLKNKLAIQIKDDGSGFDTKMHTNRNGLKNMYVRAQKWKGNCNIVSSISKGTVINVIMHVQA